MKKLLVILGGILATVLVAAGALVWFINSDYAAEFKKAYAEEFVKSFRIEFVDSCVTEVVKSAPNQRPMAESYCRCVLDSPEGNIMGKIESTLNSKGVIEGTIASQKEIMAFVNSESGKKVVAACWQQSQEISH